MIKSCLYQKQARQKVDALLEAAGWVIQNMNNFKRNSSLGVAVKEFQLTSGLCDYLLFIDGKAIDVIEAKRQSIILSEIADQSEKHMNTIPNHVAKWDNNLENIDSLPVPNVIAAEIVENLKAALEQFRSIAEKLSIGS